MARSPVLRGESATRVELCVPERVVNEPEEVLTLTARAQAEGYEAGYQAGVAAANDEAQRLAEQAAADVSSALNALRTAGAQAAMALQREQAVLESAACDLAFAIAQEILGREIELAIDPGRDAVARALAQAPTEGSVTVRCNPADAAYISRFDGLPAGTKLVPDPAIGRGGCLLDVGSALVDGRVEAALARVRVVLDQATAPR